jgi:isocitrate/isopropylmalate dehydrogenase
LIEGDGIGPEIAVSVKEIFAAAKVSTTVSCHDARMRRQLGY